MKINSLSFYNADTKWQLSKINFNKLTLLVGASGVGKTKILEVILQLNEVANGKSISGIEWEIKFTTLARKSYIWKGAFEQKGNQFFIRKTDNEEERGHPKVIREALFLDGQQIIDRDSNRIIFNGQQTVKLAQDKSIVYLLKEEDLVAPIFKSFQRIIFSDQVESKRKPREFNLSFIHQDRILQKYKTIEAIRGADENMFTKLFLAYHNTKDVMNAIKDRFIDIFPFVLDIKIAPLTFEDDELIPYSLKEMHFIQIKEKNVVDWIIQPNISSGMYRTLMHLSEIYLYAEGTVILIDEFENSLGVNCIDELTTDLQTSTARNLQFIITSHHPYIINQIPYKNWKLVTRHGNQVVVKAAADIFDFSKSKQQAFVQLTQLEAFTTGIIE